VGIKDTGGFSFIQQLQNEKKTWTCGLFLSDHFKQKKSSHEI